MVRRSGPGLVVLALILLAAAGAGYYLETHRPAAVVGACDEALWGHVYNPDRLVDPDPTKHHQCLTVTGVITSIRNEADGDRHIRLRLDAGQPELANDKNRSEQGGDLVLEPLCVGSVSQDDAKAACSGFTNHVTLPKTGDHVTVVGVYVLDTAHGWMELHPVTSITLG